MAWSVNLSHLSHHITLKNSEKTRFSLVGNVKMVIEFSGFRTLTGERMESRNLKKGIFYGWYIVIAGLITYALGYGARYSFSVLFPALLEEFHLPRDTTAAVLSFHLLIYGFISPLAGHMVDRVGPRFTIIVGAVFMSLGLALSRWGSSIGHLYLSFGIIAGAGLCFMGAVPFTTIIKNWFERKRGTAFAIITFGTGGAFALYPGVSWLIERIGWRNTFFVEACIVSGIVIPLVAIIVRYHPREKNLLPDGRPEDLGQGRGNGSSHGAGQDHLPGPAGQVFGAGFRKAKAGDNPQVGGIMLQEDEHEGGKGHHPKKGVPVGGPRRHVRRPVARVDEPHRDQKTRPDVFEDLQAAPWKGVFSQPLHSRSPADLPPFPGQEPGRGRTFKAPGRIEA